LYNRVNEIGVCFFIVLRVSGVDVNSEVPERYRKKFRNDPFDDFSRFFPREILNDLFWPVTNKFRNAQYKTFRLIWQ